MRSIVASALVLTCLVVASAAAVEAQVPGIELRLNPRIGLYAPLTDLGEVAPGEAVRLESSLAIGLGLEVGLPALPFNVRANLDYATGSSVDVQTGATGDDDRGTLLAVVGDLVFRPLPRLVVLQPYLFVGGGLKQYSFDAADFQDQSDPTVHLGAGLDFRVGPLFLNAEIGDYISWFQLRDADSSSVQHDLFVTVGFSINML